MDPCPFVRIVIQNLALNFPSSSKTSSSSAYCKFKFKPFTTQFSSSTIPVLPQETDAFEHKIHSCFTLNKADIEKLADNKTSCLKIEVFSTQGSDLSCGFSRNSRFVGCVALQLDLKGFFETSGNRACVVQNGWVLVGGSRAKLHLNVRAEPDPRFVFKFDGEPECSPQVFQVNGNVKQPVFTCKFSFRNSGERNLRSRSSLSEPSTSTSCFNSASSDEVKAIKERKGWSITVHDLSGSPVAAASMVTPFVPSPGTHRVSRSNPGAWLILRPGQGTWTPWGRLEAWCERNGGNHLGYRFELVPDGGGIDTLTLTDAKMSTKSGGKFSIDITNGPTPITSPNSSFDLSSGSGSGSGSDLGSAAGSGSWAYLLYRGFVMSSTVEGNGKCSKPEVEVGVQHVTCTEDAAAFVALAAAMDLSLDACRSFSSKLRKELRQPDSE